MFVSSYTLPILNKVRAVPGLTGSQQCDIHIQIAATDRDEPFPQKRQEVPMGADRRAAGPLPHLLSPLECKLGNPDFTPH